MRTARVIFDTTSTPHGQRSMQILHSVQAEAFTDNASYSETTLLLILYPAISVIRVVAPMSMPTGHGEQ